MGNRGQRNRLNSITCVQRKPACTELSSPNHQEEKGLAELWMKAGFEPDLVNGQDWVQASRVECTGSDKTRVTTLGKGGRAGWDGGSDGGLVAGCQSLG